MSRMLADQHRYNRTCSLYTGNSQKDFTSGRKKKPNSEGEELKQFVLFFHGLAEELQAQAELTELFEVLTVHTAGVLRRDTFKQFANALGLQVKRAYVNYLFPRGQQSISFPKYCDLLGIEESSASLLVHLEFGTLRDGLTHMVRASNTVEKQ